MAKLTKDEVEYIAKLSRLELSEEEKETYSEQLSSILGYVEKLGEVDTENVEITANVTGLSSIYRKDEFKSEECLGHDEIAKNAPEFKDGSFVVPGVFED